MFWIVLSVVVGFNCGCILLGLWTLYRTAADSDRDTKQPTREG